MAGNWLAAFFPTAVKPSLLNSLSLVVVQKIFKEFLPLLGQYRFGVKLYSFHRIVEMANAHDDMVAGLCADAQPRWKAMGVYDEGMIAHPGEWIF